VRPVLFALGPLKAYGYGAMLLVAGVVCFSVLWRRRAEAGLKTEEDFWACVNAILLSGFLSARLMYIIEYAPPGSAEFKRVIFSLSSGFSLFGSFFGVPLGMWLFARVKKIDFLPLYDHVMWMAPLGHAFGRLGCFLAGCCHGKPTDWAWGVTFTDPRAMVPARWLGTPLHPTQLVEAAVDFAIAAALWPVLKAGRKPGGLVTAGYLIAYGLLRFAVEPLRGDTLPLAGSWTVGQGLGLGLIAAGGAILVWRARCSRSC
jgi:phosphatidylglycerol:prolipoprotein diacylglycerol transferase